MASTSTQQRSGAPPSLIEYDDSDDSSTGNVEEEEQRVVDDELTEEEHAEQKQQFKQLSLAVRSAPEVASKAEVGTVSCIDPTTKQLDFNPKYEELYAPQVGPENPFRSQQELAPRNATAGYVEGSHFNQFQFENQRRTFHSYGYALDPSVNVDGSADGDEPLLGDKDASNRNKAVTVFEKTKIREGDKRKKKRNYDASDVDGYLGPWGKFVDEEEVSVPSKEDSVVLEEILAKRARKHKRVVEKPMDEEKSTLHLQNPTDYLGRSFMHVPTDIAGVNLKSDYPPEKCFIPKKCIHTWEGHTKGVQTVKLFPRFGHLLLSAGMDCRVKLWHFYNKRQLIRTYHGHKQAVRDIAFNNAGTQFLSASYDRFIKLWDTETGDVVAKFTSKRIPYCVKFNPDEDKQHLFLSGMADKKILCWDTRTKESVQEYDRHLGAVNTITFVDNNRRFITTSDDKSLRVWEWDIPVDFRYIADPTMHSMPAVLVSPNGKWFICQSMNNEICTFNLLNRMKMMKKKTFKGHHNAGYACGLTFSPDQQYLVSGDADGKVFIWNWRNMKLYSYFKAHQDVCIDCVWHPHETSKLVTCGWDGAIHLWD